MTHKTLFLIFIITLMMNMETLWNLFLDENKNEKRREVKIWQKNFSSFIETKQENDDNNKKNSNEQKRVI